MVNGIDQPEELTNPEVEEETDDKETKIEEKTITT